MTNDDQLAKKVRLMKNFGFAGYDNVTYIGTNGKMTEASAAFGLTLFESLEKIRAPTAATIASTRRSCERTGNQRRAVQ